MDSLRDLPSVDKLLQTRFTAELIAMYGRPLTIEVIQESLDSVRIKFGETRKIPAIQEILNEVRFSLQQFLSPSIKRVINASGVILHTNLGRAPLSRAAIDAVTNTMAGYSNLEYYLESGKRGSRTEHCGNYLTRLTGAEDSLVVNNNASAIFLILAALANKKKVAISRTQLVEIGGGFRIADILRQSGARIVEVGSTNRVHIDDYKEALEDGVSIILRAHHSNYKIIGFSSEPGLGELAALAADSQTILVDDLGSGTLLNTTKYGISHEPTVQESVAAGADLVCFSGDKLLGGPQAGIIVGKKTLLNKLKKHPIARVVRADKLCLAALSETLMHYLKDEADREIPIWRMISLTPEILKARVEHWVEVLGIGCVLDSFSTIGGGSLPEETIPTFVLALNVKKPDIFLANLRKMEPPVVGRIEQDVAVFDPRTILMEEESAFLVNLMNALKLENN
jgi:L-seryl-tRNA(Ser) seleniumtransferase